MGVSRLTFNGYNSSFFSQLNCEIGALWLADHLKGGLVLPSAEQQRQTIASRLAWMEERTDGKHSKGTNTIPFSVHNIDELLRDMKLPRGSLTRFKQWLDPIDPADYAVVTKRLLRRHRVAPSSAAVPKAALGCPVSPLPGGRRGNSQQAARPNAALPCLMNLS